MDNDISEIKELILQFSKLPGLGPKSAKRMVLKLINNLSIHRLQTMQKLKWLKLLCQY